MPAYREHAPPPSLAPLVACTWELDSAGSGERLVIPDACVDLIWLSGRELIVAGPDTGPRSAQLRPGTRTSGIRLRPGAAGAVVGMPASELRDQSPAAENIWGPAGRRLADALGDAAPEGRLALLAAAVAGYADQAHMNEEVRRLTGLTPVRFLKDWVPASA